MAKKSNNDKKTVKENKQKKHYFKDMKAELKKVVWPTPKQLINNTAAVIAFTLIIALIVFVLDVCFDSLNKYGILVLQEKVQSSYSSDNSEQNETESSDSEENLIEGTDVTIEDGLQETENVEGTTTGEENVE